MSFRAPIQKQHSRMIPAWRTLLDPPQLRRGAAVVLCVVNVVLPGGYSSFFLFLVCLLSGFKLGNGSRAGKSSGARKVSPQYTKDRYEYSYSSSTRTASSGVLQSYQ